MTDRAPEHVRSVLALLTREARAHVRKLTDIDQLNEIREWEKRRVVVEAVTARIRKLRGTVSEQTWKPREANATVRDFTTPGMTCKCSRCGREGVLGEEFGVRRNRRVRLSDALYVIRPQSYCYTCQREYTPHGS